jgi:uncharacterized protein YndB with AHSA1/START domain
MSALQLNVPDGLPVTEHTREFDFPASEVFRAHTDPDVFARWIGPRGLTTRVEELDCRPGGAFRFVQWGDDGAEYAFRGTFHNVRPGELVVQTFEYEGYPDVVTLEFARFEDLPGGRSRLSARSVYPNMEARERYLADGMEYGIREGYERLEEVLAESR